MSVQCSFMQRILCTKMNMILSDSEALVSRVIRRTIDIVSELRNENLLLSSHAILCLWNSKAWNYNQRSAAPSAYSFSRFAMSGRCKMYDIR